MKGPTRYYAGIALALLLQACGDSTSPAGPGGGGNPPPPPAARLKDIVIPSLPSPYYHFTYDATGRVDSVSFASGFAQYRVVYQGDRISEIRNNTLGNQDRLVYTYDQAGNVASVRYLRPDSVVSTIVSLTYDGPRLVGLERRRLLGDSLVLEKTMAFSYYPDGNLEDLTEHRPEVPGQQPATATVDHFEQYDTGINVDGFGLIHDDFFDHVVLLPGVVLQMGNPGKATRSGDGTTYTVDYTYTYDAENRPLVASGDLVLTNGQDAGKHVGVESRYSYY